VTIQSSSQDLQTEAAPAPRHVAIIMDGNGRWALERGLPRTAGHGAGVEAVRRSVRAALDLGIRHLTIYSFSSENWSRPAAEVDELMTLMKRFIRSDLVELHQGGVRLRVIGERDRIDPEILMLIDEARALTSGNGKLELVVAFNYGARSEIAKAARQLAHDVAAGRLNPDDVSEERLEATLDTAGMPELDLLIRTGGEQRLSNFLLWQAAYAELVFIKEYWPDFSREHLEQAIREYRRRERRFGGLTARSSA